MMSPRRLMIWAVSALCLSCIAESTDSVEQAVAVPGPWNPPDGVRTAAAAQRVDVVDPPNVSPLGSCPDNNPFSVCSHPACTRAHPGTAELDAYIRNRWDFVRPYGTYVCRRNSNNLSELSVHAVGRAIDAGITLTGDRDADNTLGDAVANWLVANAEYIGIQRVGWDGMWWNGERGFLPMHGDPHKNHLHIELSVDGAARRTRFFTEGPPGETCPIVCYGTAAVAADCSYVDCAANGQVCMSDPVRCETALPPEPPEAARNGGYAPPALESIGDPTRLELVGPVRVFDTRPGADSSLLVRSDGSSSPLADGRTGTVRDWPSLPAGSTGVWLNLAAVTPAENGFIAVYPEGPWPNTSSLNYEPGTVRSNAAPVPFGANDGITFRALTEAHVVADAVAAFHTDGLGLQNAGPVRVEDSRATAGPIAAETPYRIDVRAPMGAVGVTATVAVISSEPGFLTAYACGQPVPDTSSINYMPPGVVANTVVSAITDGELCIWSLTPVEVIVDITGYLVPQGQLSYQPLKATRLLDTRDTNSLYTGRLGNGQIVEIPIQSLAGAPAGIQSVTVNLTAVGSDPAGHLTTFPCGFEPPLTSSLNFGGGRNVVGTVALSTIGMGKLCVYSLHRTHLIVDLLGAWVPTPGAEPPSPGVPPESPNNPEDPDMEGMGDAGPVETDGGMFPVDSSVRMNPDDGGCGCRVPAPKAGGSSGMLLLAMGAGLLLARRRQRR